MNKEFHIAPCSSCGNLTPIVYVDGTAKKIFNENGSEDFFFTSVFAYYCECKDCGTITDPCHTLSDAVGQWNYMYRVKKF